MNVRPDSLFGRKVNRIHCVGIGGMGLGPLAVYLSALGYDVSGEDDALGPLMRDCLLDAGVRLSAGGAGDVDLLVISTAIKSDHPVLQLAGKSGVPVVRRGVMLAELMRGRKLIAVCGSHGKTSTTAMLAHVFRKTGFAAGYVLGGLWSNEKLPPARAGDNEWVVAEVDESDGTIERFSPEMMILVNLDWDHPDQYVDRTEIEQAFSRLAQRTRGEILFNAECSWSRDMLERVTRLSGCEKKSFGFNGDFCLAAIEVINGIQKLELAEHETRSAYRLSAVGDFNAVNATAALAAAKTLGIQISEDVLADYPGVGRRQSWLRRDNALSVMEDYAHHPAEIGALLKGLSIESSPTCRVVFQPHRYSRTRQFRTEFADVLSKVEHLYLLETYPAGEAYLEGGTAEALTELIRKRNTGASIVYDANPVTVLNALTGQLSFGDRVVFVGAGDIEKHARVWLSGLCPGTVCTWDRLCDELQGAMTQGTVIRREELLAKKTTIRVGGAARLYAEPMGLADLQALVLGAKKIGLPVLLLGRGSNLVVPDEGVNALVISLRQKCWETFEPLPGGRVKVGAGLRLKELCGLAQSGGLGGFEFLEGIPGNVGGALRMNAGAMGGWMFDVVESVDLIDGDGKLHTLNKDALHTGYRQCVELVDSIAVAAVLKSGPVLSSDQIGCQIDGYREKRKKSQPREPSAGCIFKNPEGDAAGRLIDISGIKGMRVGGATVSPTHGNFIVNDADATASDIIRLVRKIRMKVHALQGVWLEPEVLLFGKKWEDVL